MKNLFFVYIQPELYLAQFIIKHYGVSFPTNENDLFSSQKKYIELPVNSPEHKMLYYFLDKQPKNETPKLPGENDYPIRIPIFKDKDPRDGYTYLSENAQKVLISHFASLFEAKMSKDFLELITKTPHINISDFTYAWCERQGIDTDDGKSPETIRQKFYRMRVKWRQENSIDLT